MSRKLKHKGKRRHTKLERRGKICATYEISERPYVVESRSCISDWEGDTVAGKLGSPRLVIQVNRMSGHLAGGKAASGSSRDVGAVVVRALREETLRTIKLDRGSEFAGAFGLEKTHSKYRFTSP